MNTPHTFPAALFVAAVISLAACAPSQPPSQTPTAQTEQSSEMVIASSIRTSRPSVHASSASAHAIASSRAAASHVSVTIQNFQFSPSQLTVKRGTTVVWTNRDTAPHTVTGNSGGPASATLMNGQSYSYTFNAAGTFGYHCSFHSHMTAAVTVMP